MDRNTISADPKGFENLNINASGTKIKARVTGQDVVLELETERLTLDKLDLILEDDWRRYSTFVKEQSKNNPHFRTFNYFPDNRDEGRVNSLNLSIGGPTPSEDVAERHREQVFSGVRWLARSGFFEGDGIPFLNVRQFKTASSAGPVSITGGVNVGEVGHGFSSFFIGTQPEPRPSG